MITIYSPNASSRLSYILDTLFIDFGKLSYKLVSSADEYESAVMPKINYSDKVLNGGVTIKPYGLLTEYGVRDINITVYDNDIYDKIFFTTTGSDLPFDIFSASFWLLSRYEEYLPFKPAANGIYHYANSLAWQHGFVDRPLVNYWLSIFLQKKLLLNVNFDKKNFTYMPTVDIDCAYRYKHKGFVRSVAGLIKSLLSGKFKDLHQQIKTHTGNEKDEFDCYDFLITCIKTYKVKPIFFFLLGDYGVNDKNHPSSNNHYRNLIKRISDYTLAGIHPSFGSNKNIQQLKVECVRLTQITHFNTTRSRQHFGILRFPETYHNLIECGIREDYSLGYPKITGYRASVCLPFYWYDLSREQKTSLLVFSYCINDSAMSFNKTPLLDLQETFKIHLYYTKKYGGSLVQVFHNDILGNYEFGEIAREYYRSCIEYFCAEKS